MSAFSAPCTSGAADELDEIGYAFSEPEPDPEPLAGSVLSFHQLTGDQWDSALSGFLRQDGTVQGRWLAPVRLKYYLQRSCLIDGPDTRKFFLATAPNADPASSLRVAVGLLELERSPYEDVFWVKYVTVHPSVQRQGIAGELYKSAAAFSRQQQVPLQRSRPGNETPSEFTAAVTRLLDAAGTAWVPARA